MNPGDLVPLHFSLSLVLVSYVLSVFGSYLALVCAGHIRDEGSANPGWVLFAAVALGGVGVWCMHFIGMTAQKLPFPVRYDLVTTLLSLVAAIVVSAAAFWYVGRREFNLRDLFAGGLLVGAGVAVMHYMGMAAMNTQARLEWDWIIVAISVLIAVVAANVALWLAFNLRRRTHRVLAALVMGLAVCGMHYTGMAAGTVFCTASVATSTWPALQGSDLPYYVTVLAFTVLLLIWSQVWVRAMLSTRTA
jgi:NO-binding membrane sensor protein with MHYT domain